MSMMRPMGAVAICICGFSIAMAQTTSPASGPTTRTRNESRRDRARESIELLGTIDPTSVADLNGVVKMAELSMLGDLRQLPCDIQIASTPAGLELRGYCLMDAQKQMIQGLLVREGAKHLQDHISIGSLSADREGAVVQAEKVSVRAKPIDDSEQLTEWAEDDAMFLLREQDGYFFALGPDGYAGYVKQADVRVVKDRMLIEALNADLEKPSEISTAIDTAKTYLGTKYVWGGTTKDGIDCSGLTRAAFVSLDLNLPRDADQQSLVGRLVATHWERRALKSGDLLFFVGRHGTITHVALSLGGEEFIEAADGMVQLSSLDPKSPNFREDRLDTFCFGKRVME